MKTIKQISEEIGIPKQRVYRYIKKHHISDAHHDAGVMWYDEAAEVMIKQYFMKSDHISDAHHDVHQTASNDAGEAHQNTSLDAVIKMLQGELEIKNEQIRELNARLSESSSALLIAQQSLQASQLLHGGTMHKQLVDSDLNTKETRQKEGFFQKIFRKKNN